jgi:LysR family glycine cleavage system transcriptional activator
MEYPRRSIPSVSGLIAFEATARHLSFSRAAEELALTQGAVSKRVRQLETVLGFQLLVRNTNQVCLTEIGQKYLGDAKDLLRQLHSSTEDIRASARGVDGIRVAVPTAFAARWLVPRLSGFSRAHPNCSINILSPGSPEDPRYAQADCVVFDGLSPWRDAHSTVLATGSYIVVASADYACKSRPMSPRQLVDRPLLACNRTPDLWQRWFDAAGLAKPPLDTFRFDDLAPLIEATLAGLGAALLPDFLISEDIRNGRLRRLFPESSFGQVQYRLAVQPSHHRASVQDFVEWLANLRHVQPDVLDDDDLAAGSVSYKVPQSGRPNMRLLDAARAP